MISNRLNTLILFALLAPVSSEAANDLKGYPYEALSSSRSYQCTETEIVEPKHGAAIIYDLCVDKKFSEAGKNILRQAYKAFVRGLTSEKVYQCISHPEKPDRFQGFLSRFVQEPFGVRKVSKFLTNSNSFVSALDASYENEFSAGYLNFYDKPQFDAQKKGWQKYTSIAVRQDLVGNPSHPLGSEYEFWAAQIALSVFKNLGYKEETTATRYPSLSQDFASCLLKNLRGEL